MINRILIPDILQPVSHYCHVVEANGVVWVSGLVGMNFDETIPAVSYTHLTLPTTPYV